MNLNKFNKKCVEKCLKDIFMSSNIKERKLSFEFQDNQSSIIIQNSK